jgi:predicted Holliday junction resolvase-like endonuclease
MKVRRVVSGRVEESFIRKNSHFMSMVNRREANVAERYKSLGYRPMHIGAPDFLMLRVEDGQVKEVLAVEVKSKGAKLSYEQSVYQDVFRRAGIEYRVEVER